MKGEKDGVYRLYCIRSIQHLVCVSPHLIFVVQYMHCYIILLGLV